MILYYAIENNPDKVREIQKNGIPPEVLDPEAVPLSDSAESACYLRVADLELYKTDGAIDLAVFTINLPDYTIVYSMHVEGDVNLEGLEFMGYKGTVPPESITDTTMYTLTPKN